MGDVLIRNNKFINIGTVAGSAPVLRISPRNKYSKGHYYHRNITFEDNYVQSLSTTLVAAYSTEKLTIRNNTFEKSKDYPFKNNAKDAMSFKGCKDVLIEGNKLLFGEKLQVKTTDVDGIIVKNNVNLELG